MQKKNDGRNNSSHLTNEDALQRVIHNLRLIGFPLDTKQPELNIASLLCRDDRFVRVGRGSYTATEKKK